MAFCEYFALSSPALPRPLAHTSYRLRIPGALVLDCSPVRVKCDLRTGLEALKPRFNISLAFAYSVNARVSHSHCYQFIF